MPDAQGRIRPVSIPRVPWHEKPEPSLRERENAREDRKLVADRLRELKERER